MRQFTGQLVAIFLTFPPKPLKTSQNLYGKGRSPKVASVFSSVVPR